MGGGGGGGVHQLISRIMFVYSRTKTRNHTGWQVCQYSNDKCPGDFWRLKKTAGKREIGGKYGRLPQFSGGLAAIEKKGLFSNSEG